MNIIFHPFFHFFFFSIYSQVLAEFIPTLCIWYNNCWCMYIKSRGHMQKAEQPLSLNDDDASSSASNVHQDTDCNVHKGLYLQYLGIPSFLFSSLQPCIHRCNSFFCSSLHLPFPLLFPYLTSSNAQ